MQNDTGIVPMHALDLSSRSDRRLLGRAVRENWPAPPADVQEVIMRDLFAEYERWCDDLKATELAVFKRAARNTLIWTRLVLAMDMLDQWYFYGGNPEHYHRWGQKRERWFRRQMRDRR